MGERFRQEQLRLKLKLQIQETPGMAGPERVKPAQGQVERVQVEAAQVDQDEVEKAPVVGDIAEDEEGGDSGDVRMIVRQVQKRESRSLEIRRRITLKIIMNT